MPERVKKTKCRGVLWKLIEEGMPERVKKTKCGGGCCCEKNLRGGGMPERVKKMKCGGVWRGKIWGGGLDHTKNLGGGAVENYVFFRGGQILNGIAQCK